MSSKKVKKPHCQTKHILNFIKHKTLSITIVLRMIENEKMLIKPTQYFLITWCFYFILAEMQLDLIIVICCLSYLCKRKTENAIQQIIIKILLNFILRVQFFGPLLTQELLSTLKHIGDAAFSEMLNCGKMQYFRTLKQECHFIMIRRNLSLATLIDILVPLMYCEREPQHNSSCVYYSPKCK